MKDSSRKKMSQFYDNLVDSYGLNMKSLHGKDATYTKHSQDMKFNIVSKYINEQDSVLDIGCGIADLNYFLLKKKWKGNYEGIDISPKMVQMSNKRLEQRLVKCIDIVEEEYKKNHDVVVSISTLQHRPLFEDQDEYIKKIVKKMFSICNKYVVFDVFSDKFVDYINEENLYVSPVSFLDFLYTITPNIDFFNSYNKYQIMFVLKKTD